jgi:flagellin
MTINSLATNQLQTSMVRLSTMRRINSAADDAAGLAISNAIEAQVRGLDMGTRNTLDMQNLVTTAEGGLSTIGDSLIRMRELSIQASNGVLTDDQRAMIQTEISQLRDHINSAANSVQFNGQNLLDGSFTNRHTASDAMGRGATVSIPDMRSLALGLQNFDVRDFGRRIGDGSVDQHAVAARGNALNQTLLQNQQDLTARQADLDVARDNFATATGDFARTEAEFNMARADYRDSIGRLNEALMDAGVPDMQSLVNRLSTPGGGVDMSRLSSTSFSEIRNALQEYNRAAIEMGSDTLRLAGMDDAQSQAVLSEFGIGNDPGQQAQIVDAQVSQPGALVGQTGAMDAARTTFAQAQAEFDLAVANRDRAVTSLSNTQSMLSDVSADMRAAFGSTSLNVIDQALAQVNSVRAQLGALSNRFDHTVASNNIASLNQAAARSRIMDLDAAREVSELRRTQILQQYQIMNQRNQQENLTTRMLSLLG